MNSIAPLEADNNNTLQLVSFRENINKVQEGLREAIAEGAVEEAVCQVKHYFTPIDGKFGSYTYAREITIPTDSLLIGKIHRHQHLNIISQGCVSVITEHGPKHYVGPCTFVSALGTKRAVYAEKDTVWTTIHTVSYGHEEDLDKIEAEIIAPSYDDLNLISTAKELEMLQFSTNVNDDDGGAA